MKITDVAIDRPVFTIMVVTAAVVLGLLALMRLGVDLFPDVSFPIVSVVTPYPGASPTEVERSVTREIEEALSGINGVDKVMSSSRESASSVVVFFKLDADARRAANDVRDQVALVRSKLPKDIWDPIVSRFDPSALPIMTYTVGSPRGSVETRKVVEDLIRPRLEKVPGVASTTLQGGATREVQVLLNHRKLEAAGLSVVAVAQILGAEAMDVPSGRLKLGAREEGVKAAGRFPNVAAISEMVLLDKGQTQIRVRDVAEVREGVEEVRTLSTVNGERAISLQVKKQGGSNTVAVADAVEKTIQTLQEDLPPGFVVKKIFDGSAYIRTNMENLWHHLLVGGSMAVLVIFVFMLDWRSTFISSLALPTSIVATFFVMWQLGFTLNVMSMLGMTLAIGILIDDSVVVRENIFRHLEMGEDPVTAARKGTDEIALAVLATTLTIVAVFMPVAFTGGMIGGFFKEFGITVSVAVVISLLVSFTLDPMLSARIAQEIRPDHHERMRRHWLYGPLVRLFDWGDDVYRDLLGWTLRHRIVTVLLATGAFVGSLSIQPLLGQEFAGRGDRGELTMQIQLPAGTSLSESRATVKHVEKILGQVPEVRTIATVVGPKGAVNKARLRVLIGPKDERKRSIGQVMEDFRARLNEVPGLDYYMREQGIGAAEMEEAPITLFVRGPNYATLGEVAAEVLEVVRQTPGVRDAAMNYRPGSVEQRLSVNRAQAADRGVSFGAVAGTLRTALNGQVVSKLREGEDEVDVRLKVRAEDAGSLKALRALTVPNRQGQLVRLDEVTEVSSAATPATIERQDRQRQITITANIYGRSLGETVTAVTDRIDAMKLPEGYETRWAGEAERMTETFENLGLAMGLAVLFIYFVLASQFESFIHPITIMVALPLAIVGAFIGLLLMDKPFGMASLIGLILLMGLATKNSILLVDYANQLRDRGRTITEALLEAGPTRLRPILMTSSAIILGMLPSAMSTGPGSEFQAPMSVAVIGGVLTSTLLTLVVVPVIYTWLDIFTARGFGEWRARRRAKKTAQEASEG